MKKPEPSLLRPRHLVGVAAIALLQACASKPPVATDFGDNWKPLNTLAEVPAELPLKEEMALHRFQMLPTDSSLRDMLERWAKENGGSLDWQYPGDLSIVATMEKAGDNNLQRALNVVRRSYAAQRVRVQVLPTRDVRVSRLP